MAGTKKTGFSLACREPKTQPRRIAPHPPYLALSCRELSTP